MSGKGQRTYRRVVTTFWTDPDLRKRKITRDQRLLLLYFFTNNHTNLAGLYWLPFSYAASESETRIEDVEAWVQGDLTPYVTYDLETQEILVHRLAWHNVGEDLKKRDNRVKAIERALGDAHSQMLVEKFLAVYSAWPIRLKNVAQPRHDEGATPSPLPKPLRSPLGKDLGVAQPSPIPAQPFTKPVPEELAIQPPPSAGLSEANGAEASPREADVKTEARRWFDTARANIVDVHGSGEVVQIHDQPVGVGIEILRYMRICELGVDPPEIVAKAIAYLPVVTELPRPLSLALWENGEAGTLTDVYQRCVHEALKATPTSTLLVSAKSIPPATPDVIDRQKQLRAQLEIARRHTEDP